MHPAVNSLRPAVPISNFSPIAFKANCAERDRLIKQVALAALKELAVSFAFATATMFFVATPMSIALLFISALVIVAFNTAVRSAPVYFNYQLFLHRDLGNDDIRTRELKREKRLEFELWRNRFQSIADWCCPATFCILDTNTRDVLTHECGHAIATLAVYQNPQPQIQVKPFDGGLFSSGVTRYYPQQLSKIGESIGRNSADMIVAGAGAGFALLFSAIFIILSHKFSRSKDESQKQLGRYLLCMAITSIFRHAMYALSALTIKGPSKGHDFVKLAAGGIHPIVAVVVQIAIPLLAKGTMVLFDRICKKRPLQGRVEQMKPPQKEPKPSSIKLNRTQIAQKRMQWHTKNQKHRPRTYGCV